ncbi:hypothetical protein D3C86_1517750 [compost metagenome]
MLHSAGSGSQHVPQLGQQGFALAQQARTFVGFFVVSFERLGQGERFGAVNSRRNVAAFERGNDALQSEVGGGAVDRDAGFTQTLELNHVGFQGFNSFDYFLGAVFVVFDLFDVVGQFGNCFFQVRHGFVGDDGDFFFTGRGDHFFWCDFAGFNGVCQKGCVQRFAHLKLLGILIAGAQPTAYTHIITSCPN